MKNSLATTFRSLAIAAGLIGSLAIATPTFATDSSDDFSHLDPQGIVPKRPLRQALAYFKKYRSSFTNQNVITVIDYTRRSNEKRFFVIDLRTGKVNARLTSHGRGSDKSNTGYARSFGNKDRSHKTSLGFFRTLNTYVSSKFRSHGGKGWSVRLQGLSSTNSDAFDRAIVIHPARYVNESAERVGRSYGCPALDPRYSEKTVNQIKDGSLLYAWSGQ